MKSPRKALFLTLILLATLLPFSLAIGNPGWLTAWIYRKSHTITGSVDGAETDYQVGIFIYKGEGVDGTITKGSTVFGKVFTNNNCQDNFGDIRFTKADGTTELDYWSEYNSSGSYAIFWVEVDSIPESPSTVDIYIYYGTPRATVTTSNMANTWTDSLDWTIDLTALFTKYEPSGGAIDLEDDYLTGTSADLPCRLIVKKAITYIWTHAPYGIFTNIIARNDANDVRDSGDFAVSNLGDDTDNGATATKGAFFSSSPPSADGPDVLSITLDEYFINDMIITTGSLKSEIMTEGRINVRLQQSSADGPTDLNYWGYGYGSGSNLINEFWFYDGDEDVIEWGCALSGGGEHHEKSPWMVIGKYTPNEPEHTSWGEEEERPVLEAPNKLFGAGFNGSTPVVDLYWKTNLTDITLFEVQNSTDKVSWDYLGSNTTAEYHDFEVVNGTERYYRVRACNYTDPDWDNSTWSDINFETVYFIMPVGEAEIPCKIHSFNASSIAMIAGTLNDGNLTSTYSLDGDWYNVSEVAEIPGIDIRFNFTGIGENATCGCIDVYHIYDGHPQHDIEIQVWNFTASSWYQIGTLIYNETAGWECSGLGHDVGHFFYNGTLWARLYHEGRGHIPHEIHVDDIDLNVVYGEDCPACPPCEEAPALVAMGKYYAMAILLLILGVLIGLGMGKDDSCS